MSSGRPEASRAPRSMADRFLCNRPRKVALVAGLGALAALIIGAGFAGISSNGTTTPLETMVVRWTAVGCLAVGVVAYALGSRVRRNSH